MITTPPTAIQALGPAVPHPRSRAAETSPRPRSTTLWRTPATSLRSSQRFPMATPRCTPRSQTTPREASTAATAALPPTGATPHRLHPSGRISAAVPAPACLPPPPLLVLPLWPRLLGGRPVGAVAPPLAPPLGRGLEVRLLWYCTP